VKYMTKGGKLTGVLAVTLVMGGAYSTAEAHHSAAQFDLSEGGVKLLTGYVKKFEWGNPHTWIWLEVPNADSTKPPDLWGLEMASPGSLRASGFNYNSVAVGQKLTVDVGPARDGTHIGVVAGRITYEDGTVWIGKGTASPVAARFGQRQGIADQPPPTTPQPPASEAPLSGK
jgi:Family of unknown function (DUF6152)